MVKDLILRGVELSGKLKEKWEGPYKILQEVHPGTFKLQDMKGKTLSKTWNAQRLFPPSTRLGLLGSEGPHFITMAVVNKLSCALVTHKKEGNQEKP